MKAKLIRDLLKPHDPDAPENVEIVPLKGNPAHRQLLVAKLHEEVEEVAEDLMNAEEYGDVLEALMCLARLSGVDWSDVEAKRLDKLQRRGSFDEGNLMVVHPGATVHRTGGGVYETDRKR